MTASMDFLRDAKGGEGLRDAKGQSISFVPQREQKGRIAATSLKQTRVKNTPLSFVDQRLIDAIRRKEPLESSPILSSLNSRLVRAITTKGARFSYPVKGLMISGTILEFCERFFSSFPSLQDREVHSYLMGRVIHLAFYVPEITLESEFIGEFRYEVMKKVQKYVDERIGNLLKEAAALEGGYGRTRVADLRQEIHFVRERTKSIWKELVSLDTRPLLSEPDVTFIQRALLLEDECRQKEWGHAQALVSCEKPEEELPHVSALGDIYAEKAAKNKDLQAAVQAAGLYNYALCLVEKDTDKDSLSNKLHQTGEKLFHLCTPGKEVSYPDLRTFKAEMRRDRKGLEGCRSEAAALVSTLSSTSSPSEVQKVSNTISDLMREFTSGLIHRCIKQLGDPPCPYAIIAFGSRARKEDTPHSDLECGILIEKEAYRPYFRNLSFLLHFAVVNLGETILPCFNIPSLREARFYDARTPRGFSFDGEGGGVDEIGVATKGCKTPFGNRHTFHLIHTPEQMAAFQGIDPLDGRYWVEKEPQLPMELIAYSLIVGEKPLPLMEKYQQALDQQLARPYKEGTMRSYLAREHLYEGDEERFDPKLEELEREGRLFQIKNDLYRLPHLLIDRLALSFGLMALNTQDRVTELQQKGMIQQRAANHLRELVATTTRLRLQTYQFYKKQKDTMNAIIGPLGLEQREGEFCLDTRSVEKVKKLYQILLPFHHATHRFLQKGRTHSLQREIFWDNSPFTLAQIAMRLLDHHKAKEYYLEALRGEPENPVILNALGIVLLNLGEVSASLTQLRNALSLEGKRGKRSPAFARALNNLAMTCQEAGRLIEARTFFEEALHISQEVYANNHPLLAKTWVNLAALYFKTAEFERALTFSNEALNLDQAIYGNKHAAVARDLNTAASIHFEAERLEQAFSLYKQALEINEEIYGDQHPIVAKGMNNLALVHQKKGELKEAFALLRKVYRMVRTIFGEMHPLVASSLNHLARAYQETGQLQKAFPLFEQALRIDERVYGKQHPEVAKDLNNLALAYQEKGAFSSAISLFERARALDQKTYGSKHTTFAKRCNNLASAYQDAGNLSSAFPLFEEALAIDKAVYGEEHGAVAVDLNNLAMAYREAGNFKEALSHAQAALKITEQVYGKKHPSVAIRLNNLAVICLEIGQLEDAFPLLNRALRIIELAYGKQHSYFATALNSLGLAFQRKGAYTESLSLFEQALTINRSLYGESHVTVAKGLTNKASSLQKQGNLEQARSLFAQAQEIAKEVYEEDHPELARYSSNLGSVYQDLGQWKKASTLLVEAVVLSQQIYGQQHPTVAIYLNNLAAVHQQVGYPDKAKSLFINALTINEKAYGKDHPTYASTLSNLALVYKAEGNYEAALPLLAQALKIDEAACGAHHPTVATDLNNLGAFYEDIGQSNQARPLFERALKIDRAVYGDHHPVVAVDLSQLALACQSMGNVRRALPLFKEALAITESTVGEHHPSFAIRLNNLALAHKEKGEFDVAISLLQQALEIDEAAYGADHVAVARDLSNLAVAYQDKGEPKTALPLLERALKIDRATYKQQHPTLAIRLHNLAAAYCETGYPKRALPLFEEALTMTKLFYDEEHPQTKQMDQNLKKCKEKCD